LQQNLFGIFWASGNCRSGPPEYARSDDAEILIRGADFWR
jgi:hypothetical protein